jgi:putative ABC transport system permease protein
MIYYDYTDRAVGPKVHLERFRAAAASPLDRVSLDSNVVSPEYFDVLGETLLTGQLFSDGAHGGCRIAVVNEQAANLYFFGDAVGAAVIDETGRRTEIVGVVHSPPVGAFQKRAEPAIYFPMAQDRLRYMTLILRAPGTQRRVLVELRRRIESVPGSGPAPLVLKSLETYLNQTSLAPLRVAIVITGASAAMALLLGILGLYGALNHAARQRSRDVAIRIALGARRRDVIALVLQEGGRLAAAGILLGLLAAAAAWRWLQSAVRAGQPPELWVWISGPIVLAAVVALASVLPVRRSLLQDPLRILRDRN